jgi:hypothetical protein
MDKEYKMPDTYGSKIRNCLSPLHNIATIIQSYKRDDYMSITGEEILEWFKKSDIEKELWEAEKKLIDISYHKLIEETEYKE